MNQLSPLMQRISAIVILILLIFLSVILIIMPIIGQMNISLDKLNDTRWQLSKLDSINSQKEPNVGTILDPSITLAAVNKEEAQTSLQSYLQSMVISNGAQLDNIILAEREMESLVTIGAKISGSEISVTRLLANIENAQPLLRVKSLEFITNEEQPGQISIDVVMIAAWRKV